jgi:type II secretory ATPase GspE/PulE/Tfp pilus assembly ATPase PilB-like protein
LHTNDAASTVTRLLDMGIEAFLITAALNASIAERLVRVLCENCKKESDPNEEILKQLDLKKQDLKNKKIYTARGCKECNNTGYKGRIGLFEVLILTDEIKDLIIQGSAVSEIKDLARTQGMKLLRQDGIEKVFQGITSFEEVIRET